MGKLVYLAGPIKDASFEEANSWRKSASIYLRKYDITTLSPLRGNPNLINEPKLQDRYEESITHTQKGLTNRDRWDVQRSDLVFVNLLRADKISIGSVGEIFWADAFRTLVVLAMEEENVHQHAMIRELSTFYAKDFESALQTIVGVLGYDTF